MLERERQPVSFTTALRRRWAPGVAWEDQPESDAFGWTVGPLQFSWPELRARTGLGWYYDTELQASFSSTAGVLGDPIGSGKTATVIGLLDTQRREPGPLPLPVEDRGAFAPSRATLLLVPSNLVLQWEREIERFLGPRAFRLLVIRSIHDLRAITLEQLVGFEIVLASYKIFYSVGYIERLRSLQCTRANRLHERSFLGKPIQRTLQEIRQAARLFLGGKSREVGWSQRAYVPQDEYEDLPADGLRSAREVERRLQCLGECEDWRSLQTPVFELVYWHRVIFDEFHELEAMDRRRASMLQNLRAHRRWGLTGTPPTRDVVQIADLARILRVHISDLKPEECQKFLDTFVRQNKADLPEIPVEEHMVLVCQTPEERALYLQQEHDGNRRQLLQFCSHHALQKGAGGEEQEGLAADTSARATVTRLGDRKREALAKCQKAAGAECRALAALTAGLQGCKRSQAKVDVEAEEKFAQLKASISAAGLSLPVPPVGATNAAELAKAALPYPDRNRPGGEALVSALQRLANGLPPLSSLKPLRTAQLSRATSALQRLLGAVRSLRFFEATLSMHCQASDGKATSDPTCAVCLEQLAPRDAAILPCAHVFHEVCAQQVLAAAAAEAMCPECRAPFQRRSVARLCADGGAAGAHSELDREVGSKLAAVGRTLRQIRTEDPSAKVIVFVQWRELEALVSQALERMGVEHLRLRGPALQRGRIIEQFQEGDAGPHVLLQSLENSASGSNLTRASHVLLLHPMDAESKEVAVAYEMQALGRVRRCGQRAGRVHLWRFVTAGTIEEEISEEHRRGVLEGLATTAPTAGPLLGS